MHKSAENCKCRKIRPPYCFVTTCLRRLLTTPPQLLRRLTERKDRYFSFRTEFKQMELLKNWISQAITFSIIFNLISESISTKREYKQRSGEWIISHKRNLILSSRVYQSFSFVISQEYFSFSTQSKGIPSVWIEMTLYECYFIWAV